MATTDKKLIGPPMRLSYPFLFVPVDCRTKEEKAADPPTPPKMRCKTTLIVDKVSQAYVNPLTGQNEFQKLWNELVTAVRQAALSHPEIRKKAGAFLTKNLFGIQDLEGAVCSGGGVRSPFKDGSKYVLTDADGKVTGYKEGCGPGTVIIDTWSNKPFLCVDRKAGPDGRPLRITEADNKLYSGCYVQVSFNPRPYTTGSYGVGLFPRALQFFQDGERLDGQVDPSEEFGPLDAAEPGDITSVFAGMPA